MFSKSKILEKYNCYTFRRIYGTLCRLYNVSLFSSKEKVRSLKKVTTNWDTNIGVNSI